MKGLREWERDRLFGRLDLISSVMLVCAVVASLGVGVMLAQLICVGMFRVFRMHARQVAAARRPEGSVAVRLDVVGS